MMHAYRRFSRECRCGGDETATCGARATERNCAESDAAGLSRERLIGSKCVARACVAPVLL